MGEHLSLECSWEREVDLLTLWCPLMTSEHEDLGTSPRWRTSTRDSWSTASRVIWMLLSIAMRTLWGFTKLQASDQGRFVSMEFGTRRTSSGQRESVKVGVHQGESEAT